MRAPTSHLHLAGSFAAALAAHAALLALLYDESEAAMIHGERQSVTFGLASATVGHVDANNAPPPSEDATADTESSAPSDQTHTIKAEPTPDKAPPFSGSPEDAHLLEPEPIPESPAHIESATPPLEVHETSRSEPDRLQHSANEGGEETSSVDTPTASASDDGTPDQAEKTGEQDTAGATNAEPTPETTPGHAAPAGNAEATNFAGLVMQHLSRVRRPRASSPGSTHVSFTLGEAGEILNLHIVQSSGSGRFDRDAIRVVERAAPFPAPPSQINRTFTVEIKGR